MWGHKFQKKRFISKSEERMIEERIKKLLQIEEEIKKLEKEYNEKIESLEKEYLSKKEQLRKQYEEKLNSAKKELEEKYKIEANKKLQELEYYYSSINFNKPDIDQLAELFFFMLKRELDDTRKNL